MLVFKLAYFVEHNISYQPCKFQLSKMSGSNFTEGGAVPGAKSSAFRVKFGFSNAGLYCITITNVAAWFIEF